MTTQPDQPDTPVEELVDVVGHSYGDDEEDPNVAITATGGICIDG